jgi:very-short-patch-repair endonuclease
VVNDAIYSPFMTNSQLADVVARNPHHKGGSRIIPFLAET